MGSELLYCKQQKFVFLGVSIHIKDAEMYIWYFCHAAIWFSFCS